MNLGHKQHENTYEYTRTTPFPDQTSQFPKRRVSEGGSDAGVESQAWVDAWSMEVWSGMKWNEIGSWQTQMITINELWFWRSWRKRFHPSWLSCHSYMQYVVHVHVMLLVNRVLDVTMWGCSVVDTSLVSSNAWMSRNAWMSSLHHHRGRSTSVGGATGRR